MKIDKQALYQLKADRAEALKAAEEALEAGNMEVHTAKMAEVETFNGKIDATEKLLAERERFQEEQEEAKQKAKPGLEQEEKADGYETAVKELAKAARAGFRYFKADGTGTAGTGTTPAAPAAANSLMSEGSDPDGGYTIPHDIVTKIIQLRQAKESLLDLAGYTAVKTFTGRRTFQKREEATPFLTVEEAAKIGKLATPQFSTLEYSIKKRGGYMVVTNELLSDSDNNIAAVVQNWLADHDRVTANKLILDKIHSKTAKDLTNLDGILDAWIGLDEFMDDSVLITNRDGLYWLGTLKDKNGRQLLTPNPADPKQLRVSVGPYSLPVKHYSNKTISTAGSKIPMILGYLKEGVMFWDRQSMSVLESKTAVAGDFNAFEQDVTLWRGLLRNDCTLWDDAAFVNGYITKA